MIGPAHIEALNEARAGSWTTLDFTKANGIVTFPSFHAIFAVIFTYAVRRVRWAFAIMAPLNAMMLMSTPTVGGHYLVDAAAGIAVAVAVIVLTKAIQRRTANVSHRSTDAIFGSMEIPSSLRNALSILRVSHANLGAAT